MSETDKPRISLLHILVAALSGVTVALAGCLWVCLQRCEGPRPYLASMDAGPLAALATLEIGSALAFFLGSLITAVVAGLPAYFSYKVSMKTDEKVDSIKITGDQTHEAVNHTAAALADEKKVMTQRLLDMTKRIATLEESNRLLAGQRIGPTGEQGPTGAQGKTGPEGKGRI